MAPKAECWEDAADPAVAKEASVMPPGCVGFGTLVRAGEVDADDLKVPDVASDPDEEPEVADAAEVLPVDPGAGLLFVPVVMGDVGFLKVDDDEPPVPNSEDLLEDPEAPVPNGTPLVLLERVPLAELRPVERDAPVPSETVFVPVEAVPEPVLWPVDRVAPVPPREELWVPAPLEPVEPLAVD